MKDLLEDLAYAFCVALGMTISLLCVAWSAIATGALVAVIVVWYGFRVKVFTKAVAEIRGCKIWQRERFRRLKISLITRRKTDGHDSA